MAIDLSSQEEIQKLKLEDLVADAVERKDEVALNWLQDESSKTVERKRSDGTTFAVDKSILSIRAEYIRKFLNYTPASALSKEEAKARKREKREKARSEMFAQAFAQIK